MSFNLICLTLWSCPLSPHHIRMYVVYPLLIIAIIVIIYIIIISIAFNCFIFMNYLLHLFLPQISTNNCTARYRTLSGGLGNSPSLSPSPSSDYEDIGIGAPRALPPSLAAKVKKNGAIATKSNTISQKATIHHVSSSSRSRLRYNHISYINHILG